MGNRVVPAEGELIAITQDFVDRVGLAALRHGAQSKDILLHRYDPSAGQFLDHRIPFRGFRHVEP
jgi:hypothetical protein